MVNFRREKNCTFCSKSCVDVDTMFWSRESDFCICDTCVTTLHDKCPKVQLGRVGLTARDIYHALRGRVVGQDDCLRELSVVLLRYMAATGSKGSYSDLKVNCLLVGPTGCGKTMTLELAAKLLGFTVIVIDCSKLTPSGYVGEGFDESASKGLRSVGNNVARFENGCWFLLDEFDKMGISSTGLRGEIGKGDIQHELLKPVEGCKLDIPLDNKRNYYFSKTVRVSTYNMLFVGAGCFYEVFHRLDKAKRFKVSNVYSLSAEDMDENDTLMLRRNIIKAGIIPELAARFPAIIRLNPLNKEHMLELLYCKHGKLNLYVNFVMSLGVSVSFTDGAISIMADYALKLEIGCRGLNYILDRVFQHIIYHIGPCGPLNCMEKAYGANEVEIMIRKNIYSDDEVALIEKPGGVAKSIK